MDAEKDHLLDALSRYFLLPHEEEMGESWLILSLEAEMIKAGINDVAEIASIVMSLYWVNVNCPFSFPACHPLFRRNIPSPPFFFLRKENIV